MLKQIKKTKEFMMKSLLGNRLQQVSFGKNIPALQLQLFLVVGEQTGCGFHQAAAHTNFENLGSGQGCLDQELEMASNAGFLW